jgi:AcrR family transcriptional regulator
MDTTAHSLGAEVRRPGRPRSAAADRAILEAALEEYAANGYEGMSVDGVAARAGVGKSTIYRRFVSKLELVTAAMYEMAELKGPKPDTGSLRSDLRASLRSLAGLMRDPVLGRAMRMMAADAARHPELGGAHEEFVRSRRRRSIDALERAVARGELRRDVDLEVAIDTYTGPLFYRHLVSHMPIDGDYIEQVVDGVIAAYGSVAS